MLGYQYGLRDGMPRLLTQIQLNAYQASAKFADILGLASPSTVFHQHGVNTMLGYQYGLRDGLPSVISEMQTVVTSITKAFTSALGIASPSTLFAGYGRSMMEGLASGISGSVGVVTNAVGKMVAALTTAVASATGGGGTSSATPAAVTAMVKKLAASQGWDAAQIADWQKVIMQESGGSTTAKNASSGAYGIAQFINGPSEYAQYGGNSTSVSGQLTAMMNYIKERYGTPSKAEGHELSSHWYDSGGWLPPGPSIAINKTGVPERVLAPNGSGGGGDTYNLTIYSQAKTEQIEQDFNMMKARHVRAT
jgi:hypothetical protein